MITLSLTEERAEKMENAEDMALDIIQSALKEDIDAEDERVKVSIKLLAVVSKNRQTITNRASLGYHMVSTVASPDQLKKYVESTSPEIKKALGSRKQIK